MPVRVTALSIVDAVTEDLRRSLFAGELAEGAMLTEAGISERYAVARPTAKAAIEKLVAEGLLHRGAHRTARVPVVGVADVVDLYRTRALLESEAVRHLAGQRRVPDDAAVANREVRAVGDVSSIEIVGADMRFHTALIDGLGSPRVSRAYRSLVAEVRLCMSQVQGRHLISARLIAQDHDVILGRIADGDGEGAAGALGGHLTRSSDRLSRAVEVPARP